jgi:hypothetical protein
MKTTNETLSDSSMKKVDILLSFGATHELNNSLNKLIFFQIAKYRNHINQIDHELKSFETRYKMSSEEFFNKFESGLLGDAADFFEWAGLYENSLLYKKRIQSLETVLNK